jgi:hypothetical protein
LAWQSIIFEKLKGKDVSCLSNSRRGTKVKEVAGFQAIYLRAQDIETVSWRLETS